jgi:hypothetical protein
MNTLTICSLLSIVGLLPVVLLSLITKERDYNSILQVGIIYNMFFFWGLAGMTVMIRKEMPGIFSIRGWLAVVTGLLMLVSNF